MMTKPVGKFRVWARKTQGIPLAVPQDWKDYKRDSRPRRALNLQRILSGDFDHEDVDRAFTWLYTPQGPDFWSSVANKRAATREVERAQKFAEFLLSDD